MKSRELVALAEELEGYKLEIVAEQNKLVKLLNDVPRALKILEENPALRESEKCQYQILDKVIRLIQKFDANGSIVSLYCQLNSYAIELSEELIKTMPEISIALSMKFMGSFKPQPNPIQSICIKMEQKHQEIKNIINDTVFLPESRINNKF